jgi:tetratricopeptide (TPR) repeat protein
MNHGNLYFQHKRYTLAIEDYSKVIDLDPRSQTAYANRAMAYYHSGQRDKAIAD